MIIYSSDPDALEKLERRKEELTQELNAIRAENQRARETGAPLNPKSYAARLRSRIRDTQIRIDHLKGRTCDA